MFFKVIFEHVFNPQTLHWLDMQDSQELYALRRI